MSGTGAAPVRRLEEPSDHGADQLCLAECEVAARFQTDQHRARDAFCGSGRGVVSGERIAHGGPEVQVLVRRLTLGPRNSGPPPSDSGAWPDLENRLPVRLRRIR